MQKTIHQHLKHAMVAINNFKQANEKFEILKIVGKAIFYPIPRYLDEIMDQKINPIKDNIAQGLIKLRYLIELKLQVNDIIVQTKALVDNSCDIINNLSIELQDRNNLLDNDNIIKKETIDSLQKNV